MKQPCARPGCPALVESGYCEKHRGDRRDRRPSAYHRGYGGDWEALAKRRLNANPLCQHCLAAGRITPASEVDHIVPLSQGGARLDFANTQALCHRCHVTKTWKDRRRGGVNP